jgi:hypothetical protein
MLTLSATAALATLVAAVALFSSPTLAAPHFGPSASFKKKKRPFSKKCIGGGCTRPCSWSAQ